MATDYIRNDPIIMFKDLTPQKDPKGGSPKTPPGGIRKADIPASQQTPWPPYWTTDMEPKKVGFFHVQFRDILFILSIAGTAMLFIFQRQSDVHDLNVKVTIADKAQARLEATVTAQGKLIDANTTGILLQSARNIEQDKEISRSTEQLLLLVPGMAKIEVKLNFVADLLDGKSKGQR